MSPKHPVCTVNSFRDTGHAAQFASLSPTVLVGMGCRRVAYSSLSAVRSLLASSISDSSAWIVGSAIALLISLLAN